MTQSVSIPEYIERYCTNTLTLLDLSLAFDITDHTLLLVTLLRYFLPTSFIIPSLLGYKKSHCVEIHALWCIKRVGSRSINVCSVLCFPGRCYHYLWHGIYAMILNSMYA